MATGQNILNTLGYFDLFHYPLTREEIGVFHPELVSPADIDHALTKLLIERSVFRLDEFYSLQNDFTIIQRRRTGNSQAITQMKIAGNVARLLASFPYVSGVAVSGSLSKNFANEKTDIDFFIVTAPNRLWIARTFMHLYKKLTFLTGRQHWYCMNYYVDEAGLEITEKNIFTAMEIVTLVPMQGRSSLDKFIAGNDWIKNYFPAHPFISAGTAEIKPGLFRKGIEKIFNGRMGNRIDGWLMHITARRWQKKAARHKLNSNGICMGMVAGRHFSKPDPKNFQEKVVEKYHVKVKQLLQQKNTSSTLIF